MLTEIWIFFHSVFHVVEQLKGSVVQTEGERVSQAIAECADLPLDCRILLLHCVILFIFFTNNC